MTEQSAESAQTLVVAEYLQAARRWCKDNDVDPGAPTTTIVINPVGLRGRRLRSDDRVIVVGTPSPEVVQALAAVRVGVSTSPGLPSEANDGE